jgi:hypothetical protein
VPIIPKATSIQLEFLFPIKNDSLLEFLEVKYATISRSTKYPITKARRIPEFIAYLLKVWLVAK